MEVQPGNGVWELAMLNKPACSIYNHYMKIHEAYFIFAGMRGLCNGLGPLLFGFIFYLSHVSLSETAERSEDMVLSVSNVTTVPTVEPLHHVSVM